MISSIADYDNLLFLIASLALTLFSLFALHRQLLGSVAKDVSKRRSSLLVIQPWRGRDKTRSTNFMINALYQHTVVKSKKMAHGLGGLIGLSLSFILTVWIMVTGGAQRGPDILAKMMAIALVVMNVGHFTPHFQKKIHKLGKFRLMPLSNMILCLGFAMGANSIYAQPSIPSDIKNDIITQFCTSQSLALPVLSLFFFAQAMIQKACFNTANPGITFSTCLGYFYAPFFYELWYGKEALIELYNSNTHMGDLVYFLHVSGLFCTLIDNIFTIITLLKVFTLEQSRRVLGIMWGSYGALVIILLASVVSPIVAFIYTFMVGCVFPFHKIFPVRDLPQNQKKLGIFVQENGGNNLGFGVGGTSKNS